MRQNRRYGWNITGVWRCRVAHIQSRYSVSVKVSAVQTGAVAVLCTHPGPHVQLSHGNSNCGCLSHRTQRTLLPNSQAGHTLTRSVAITHPAVQQRSHTQATLGAQPRSACVAPDRQLRQFCRRVAYSAPVLPRTPRRASPQAQLRPQRGRSGRRQRRYQALRPGGSVQHTRAISRHLAELGRRMCAEATGLLPPDEDGAE